MTRPSGSSPASTRLLSVIVCGAMLATACGTSASDSSSVPAAAAADGVTGGASTRSPANPPLQKSAGEYREVTIPSGTALNLTLTSAIASDTSQVEDAVSASLNRAVILNGREVLPAGAIVGGHVTVAEDSERVKGRAKLSFLFTTLTTGGDRYHVRTAAVSRVAPATKGEDATKIGIGAGAGAIIGGLIDGKEGAAKGAAVGGGAGAGVVLATKGKEMRLAPGADVTTALTAPLTIRVRMS
jgi:hypothetical protein